MPLHPQFAPLLQMMAEAGLPPLDTLDPVSARALTRAAGAGAPPGPAVGHVEDLRLPARHGTLAARLYRPCDPADALMIYYHGGGWVLGDLDSCDALARAIAARSSVALLSVDYRLAPEHPFPAAADDAVDALFWARDHVERLAGADVPLLVGGDSAGGNLAIVAALEARDAGLPLAFQLLFYPVTDGACATPSYEEQVDAPILTRSLMRWFWNHYVPDADRRGDWRASPIRAADFAGLPPAFIQTAELDPLRDEGEAYGAALRAAGVPVTVERLDGFVHGFASFFPFVPDADAAIDRAAGAARAAIREARGTTGS